MKNNVHVDQKSSLVRSCYMIPLCIHDYFILIHRGNGEGQTVCQSCALSGLGSSARKWDTSIYYVSIDFSGVHFCFDCLHTYLFFLRSTLPITYSIKVNGHLLPFGISSVDTSRFIKEVLAHEK